MARSDNDTWDLASSVGATAMVATGRAVVSQDPDGLIDDPFAAPLVRAVGIEVFTMMVDGTLDIEKVAPEAGARVRANIDEMAVRTSSSTTTSRPRPNMVSARPRSSRPGSIRARTGCRGRTARSCMRSTSLTS